MEDKGQDPNSPGNGSERSSEPVRSRWIPKPEQILILESIFNSGMVNPPKEETVRIRKLLEKFGTVGDANVFYWFQNRRSRSRRRQRQLQASLEQRNNNTKSNQVGDHQMGISSGAIQYEISCSPPAPAPAMAFGASPTSFGSCNYLVGSSSSSSSGHHLMADHDQQTSSSVDPFFSVSGQMGFPEIEQGSGVTSVLGGGPSDTSTLHFQSGRCMANLLFCSTVSLSHLCFYIYIYSLIIFHVLSKFFFVIIDFIMLFLSFIFFNCNFNYSFNNK